MQPAAMRARRLPVPHGDWGGAGRKRCRAGDAPQHSDLSAHANDAARKGAARMSTTTMSVTGTATEVTLERVTFWLLLAFVAALQMSIAAANVLLAMTFVCWVAVLVRDRSWWSVPAFFVPLV